MKRSSAFFAVIIVLAIVRWAARGYFDRVLSLEQTGAIFYLLAFGMILRWRLKLFLAYRALTAGLARTVALCRPRTQPPRRNSSACKSRLTLVPLSLSLVPWFRPGRLLPLPISYSLGPCFYATIRRRTRFPDPISIKEKPMPNAPAMNSLAFRSSAKAMRLSSIAAAVLSPGSAVSSTTRSRPSFPTTSASFSTSLIWPSSTAWVSALWCDCRSRPNQEAPASSSSILANKSGTSWESLICSRSLAICAKKAWA